jgi:hypothetical protein
VCTAPGQQSSIGIVDDGNHGAIVAWRDTRTDTDYYATRVLANGQLAPSWPVNGTPIVALAGAQINASFTSDGHGGIFATWQDARGGPDFDIYAQHLLVTGATAAGWPVNGRAVCTAIGVQQFPSITADPAGGVFVGWEDYRAGASSDIYVQHVQPGGIVDPAWPANGSAACTAVGNQTRPRVLAEGTGGVYVAWIDARLGSIPTLFAQHLLPQGGIDPVWPPGDLEFCAAFGSHANLTFLSDGTEGALITWDDGRGGLHVYAHHLLINGTVDAAWPTDGRAVSGAVGSQNANGAAIPDGSGGLIVAWTDTRTGTVDIYGQRVQANGALGGTIVGVAPTTPPDFSLGPVTPTPSLSGRLGLHFTLPGTGTVHLELFDAAGRRLAERDLGSLSAGSHTFVWELSRPMPPGLHLVRMQYGHQARTLRAVLLE